MSLLKISKIPKLNILVIKQDANANLFIAGGNSIVIGIPSLIFLIKYLVMSGSLSPKSIEGILEDFYSNGK